MWVNRARKSVKCLILDPSGTLMISNAEQSLSQTLSTSVEQFWMANTELEDLGNTLWAYGRNGLQVSFSAFFASVAHDNLNDVPIYINHDISTRGFHVHPTIVSMTKVLTKFYRSSGSLSCLKLKHNSNR